MANCRHLLQILEEKEIDPAEAIENLLSNDLRVSVNDIDFDRLRGEKGK